MLDSVSDVREPGGMIRPYPGLCLLGLGLSLSAHAFAAPPIIAVTESPTNTAPRALRLEIRPTVEAALKERGAAVVPHAKVVGDLAKCTSGGCATRIGAATGATHVLVIDSSYVDDGYRMRLQVFDGRTGRERYSDGQVCEVCTHDDFTKALRERTAILWSRIQTEETLPPPAPVMSPTAAPVPGPVSLARVEPPVIAEPAKRSWIPWAIIGVGAPTAVYGVLAIKKSGKTDGGPSPGAPSFTQNSYASGGLGWGCFVGGGLVAIAGAIWVFATPTHSTTVSISPSHVALGMRF